ncbi:MAG TPA: cation-translocating P-type ATPase [Polyangia bacterium]|nr:cation-translocating P-type ATPase [Polyangia bacterium]
MTNGLTADLAARRLAEAGPNEIAQQRSRSPWSMLLGQFASPLIWLLMAACVVSGVLGDAIDAVAIGVILLLNALVGFFQEYRAEKAISALREMTAPEARVLRDGHAALVAAAAVVPGDLLLLEAGDVVAADARLLDAHALTTNEAALTGESLPVEKQTSAARADAPLAERRDSVFMGTSVATGTARAEVVATGMRTELGRIAHLLAHTEETETPLQGRLRRLGRTLLFLAIGIVLAVAALGLARGLGVLEVFMSAVSLAVAAVPEGLPSIVTIALAIGVRRMAARNVLVRKLPAVETLGCATVICTDKTGTLTAGRMAVRELWGPDQTPMLAAAAACCDAQLGPGEGGGVGDPTEVAILVAAAERGVARERIEAENPRVAESPFDSERKRMSILRRDGRLYVKGAVEVILARATEGTEGASPAADAMAGRGLRVLAVALGSGEREEALRLLGLIGIADPPRPEATAAVAAAREAGIRTVMITGDHPVTASAIAREMGIVEPGEDAAELVHARATPEDKLRIVRRWKSRGAVVAMTGDGVNDAPALREAHIGIAMGRAGTAVTREAADIVLADDNFASIVAGIREGRGIFENIRKSLLYLLGGNSGELMLMLGAAIAGLPTPLLPLQILWINLVTDGLPALALVLDAPDRDVLRHPPRRVDEPMLGRPEWGVVLLTGAILAGTVFAVFAWTLSHGGVHLARSLSFTTLVFGHTIMALAFRNPAKTVWELGLLTNRRLLLVIGASGLIQLVIVLSRVGQGLFQLTNASLKADLVAALLGFIPVIVLEAIKLVRHRIS